MTKIEKLQQKVEELKEAIFLIDMIDTWTQHNEEMWEKYHEELNQVKDLLAKELLKKGVE